MSKEKNFSLKDNKLYTFKNFIYSIIISNDGNFGIILYPQFGQNKISKIDFNEKMIINETINVDIDNNELYPSYNKLVFAYSKNNEIFIIDFSNLNVIKKFIINNINVKIKFIEWQDKKKGLISCVTNENIVYFFDQNTKIFDINNKDEEIFSLKFFNYKEKDDMRINNYIILGVNNNIKLYKLRKNKIYNKKFSYENIEYENINIIEILNNKNNEIYILIGNKEKFKFNIYIYKNDNFKLLYVLDNFIKFFKNLDDKIISLNYIDKEGIIVCMKKKIYLFYINNDDIFLENDIESEEEIQNFKVVKGKNNYIFYTTGSKIKSIKFDFNNNNLNLNNLNNNIYKQFEREKNDFLFEMKNKSNVYIDIDNYENTDIYSLDIFDVKLKIEFTSNSNKIAIIKCSDNNLKKILDDEIEKFNNKDNSNKNTIKTFNDLYTLIVKIEKIDLSEKKTIVPYFTNNNFTFTKTGGIIKYNYHKIDFNLLNENNKEIKNYSNLNSWIKFCIDNNSHLNFVFNEDKLIPEDEKVILSQTLRELTKFNFSKGKDISEYFNFINTEINTKIFEDKTNNKLNSNEENSQNTKKRFHLISFDYEENFKILDNLNINLLNDKQFYQTLINSLNSLNSLNTNDDIIYIINILEILNHNINEMLIQKELNLIKFYQESIYNITQIIERNKSFEILFICVFFLASRIFEEFLENNENIEKEKKKILSSNNLMNNEFKTKNFPSEEILIKIENYNDILESDDNLFLDIKENNNDKINNSELSINNINYSPTNTIKSYDNKSNYFSDNNESQNFNKIYINQSNSFPNFNLKQKKSKNLINFFDKSFINILIQYLIYISEEFIKMGRENESEEIKEFVNLINKYQENF